jgi:hypothetical protein
MKALRMRVAHRRSGHRETRPGRGIQTSKRGRLERKKAAAEGSRKVHRGRERGRNSNYRLDFEAREPPRATALFPMAEPRSSGSQCRSRRRTSLHGQRKLRRPCAASIPQPEFEAPARRRGKRRLRVRFFLSADSMPENSLSRASVCCPRLVGWVDGPEIEAETPQRPEE